MSKNRRKGKRRTDKSNQKGQGIAWLVIIMYLGLLAVIRDNEICRSRQ